MRNRWHGPESLAGAGAGLLVQSLPLLVRAPLWGFALVPLVGLVLLAARGPLRRLGVGLLASGLAYPVALASYAVSGVLLR